MALWCLSLHRHRLNVEAIRHHAVGPVEGKERGALDESIFDLSEVPPPSFILPSPPPPLLENCQEFWGPVCSASRPAWSRPPALSSSEPALRKRRRESHEDAGATQSLASAGSSPHRSAIFSYFKVEPLVDMEGSYLTVVTYCSLSTKAPIVYCT